MALGMRGWGLVAALAAWTGGPGALAGPPPERPAPGSGGEPRAWNFDDVEPGGLPVGWRVGSTGPGRPPATWEVVETRPGSRVLALTRPNHHSSGTFNLCWTEAVRFGDGAITVRFHADAGRVDQGGGILWRARDAANYYVARFNPLEDNFRFYTVHDGVRRMVASADVHLDAGWHEMRIVQRGDRFEGWLDGRRLLSATDATFPEPGGVGLWTKADAATSFDDFRVTPATLAAEPGGGDGAGAPPAGATP